MKTLLRALLIILVLALPTGASAHSHPPRPLTVFGAGWYRITAYLPTGNRTATGIWPYYGEVAVDPRVIPLGAWVHIDGLGTFRAEDTGGLVWGRHLDIFVWSMAQAYAVQGSGYRRAYWWYEKP